VKSSRNFVPVQLLDSGKNHTCKNNCTSHSHDLHTELEIVSQATFLVDIIIMDSTLEQAVIHSGFQKELCYIQASIDEKAS